MSNTVDSRVVEMRFDNKQFESNVATSMSTLDKLKQKLNLTSSAKSLEGLGDAAKKCDMSGLGRGIEAVHTKFSALQVMGVTALANITNSAINSGKRIVKALTIDPVKTGLSEYETQINAIQTILANTRKEGTTVKDVNEALDELNAYADRTIYNFTEMTRNIGTFTAAGVKLETSVNAIQGIANLAAVSGSTSQQASTAMYQLSQALSTGTVKLMDWNSVVNAGMGGQVFQDALKETSRLLGTGADAAIKAEGSFRESLSTGWLTAEVLTETLKKFTTSGANEYVAEYTGLSKEAVAAALEEAEARYGEANAIEKASEALAKKSGKNKEEIKDALEFAKTAEDAATKVKTFTQLWDVLKEAAQSGWAQTWRLIIGDFEEAKAIFTPLSEFLTGIINKMSDARNTLLKNAFGIDFGDLSKSLSKITRPIKKVTDGAKEVTETIGNVTGSFKDLGIVVDEVIGGKFGNGQERFDKLTKAGYNYCEVQNEINEKLGCSFRYTKEQIAAQNKLIETQEKSTKSTSKAEKETSKLTKAQKEEIKKLAKLSDEQLRNRGYTEDQIEALHELKNAANQIGMPLDDLIDKMDEINGRWLLIDSFKNIGKSLVKIFSSIGDGFRDVFDPIKPEQLFNAIAAFHKFTTQLIISDKTADKLKRTFRGLFAAIDIVSRIAGGGLRIAFTLLSSIFKAFGITALDATASIGDLIYKFDQWLKEHDIITKSIEKLAELLKPVAEIIKEFITNLEVKEKAGEAFKKIAEGLESIWTVLHGKFTLGLRSSIKLLDAVLGLFDTNLSEIAVKIADLITKFADWIDKNTLLTNGLGKIANIIKLVIEGITKCVKAFTELEPVKNMVEKISNAFAKLGEVFDFDIKGTGIDTLFTFISDFFTNLEKWVKDLDKSETFKKGLNIVEGLADGISSGVGKVINAITGIARNLIDAFCGLLGINSPSKLFMIFGGNIITGLIKGLSKSAFKPIEIIKSIAIKLINAFKSLLGINSPSAVFMSFGAFIILGLLIGLKKGLPEVYDVLSDGMINIFKIVGDILQNGLPKIYDFIKLIGSKLYSSFEGFDMQVGELFVAGSIIATLLLINKALGIAETLAKPFAGIAKAIEKFNGVIKSTDKFIKAKALEAKANAIKSLAIAIAIMAASVYLLSRIPLKDLVKGVAAIAVLTGLIIALVAVTSKLNGLEGLEFGKISVLMVTLGITLMLFSSAIKRIAELNPKRSAIAVGEMIALISILAAFFAAFGKCVKGKTAENMNKAGIMLLKMSFAIGILAIVIKLMSKLEWADMAKGGAVIVGIFTIFIAVGKLTKRVSKNIDLAATAILKMSFAIGILAIVLRLMSKLEWADLAKGGAVIVGTFTLFWAITKFCKNISKNLDMASVSILKMSAAILLLSIAIRLLGGLEISYIVKGGVTIAAFFAMFWAMTKLCKNISKNIDLAATAIVKMSAAILLLSVAMLLLGRLKLENVVKGSIAIAAFFAMFWALMKFTKRVSKSIDAAGTAIVKMSGAIILLSVAILLLSMLDPGKVATGTVCVSALLAMFALICHNLKFIDEKSLKSLTIMTVAIAILAGALIALSFLDIASVITASACLSAVIGMFALLSYASKYAAGSLGSLIVMTVAIGMIGAALYILGQLPCEKALAAAGSLSIVLLAMSAALLICSKAMAITPTAILAMAGMTLILLALVGIFAIMNELNIKPSLEVAIALSVLLLAMSGALMILAGVGAVAGPALVGLGTLLLAVTAIGAFITGVGAIFKYCAGLEGILDKGIDILCKIGHGIGLFIGSIGGGILEGIDSGLASVGKTLSDFMVGLTPFLSGLSTVNPDMAVAAKNLALTILAITGAGILEAIGGWLTGGSSITSFVGQLKEFGKGMKAYGNEVSGIDTASITASAEAARALTKVANNLPKEGGVWQALAGQKDMASFGSKLKAFGKGMKDYAAQVAGIDVEAISSSANAAKALTKVANNLPKEGGVWQVLAGQQDISSFGSKLKAFGKGMKDYGTQVAGVDTEAISASAKAAKALTAVANNIPKDGGIWQKFAGNKDISSFGKKLKSFGNGIKGYGEAVSGINAGAIDASVSAAKKIIGVIKSTDGIDTDGVKKFVKAIDKLGEADMDSVASAFSGAQTTSKMVSAGVKMVKSVGSGIKSSSASVKSSAKSVANSVASAFKSQTGAMKSAGTSMINAAASSIKSGKGMASAANSAAKKAADAMKRYKGFKSAGSDAVSGFCKGITENTWKAEAKSRAMAEKAIKAARKALREKSPSRVFIEIGKYVSEGFAIGITRATGLAENASEAMAVRTMDIANNALSLLGNVIDSDMDVQPTISPVVDLSNVKAGAGAINGLLGQDVMLGASANLSAINYGMSRNQNGVNDDVVSAINKLRKDLCNISGDTYQINGVTYDDGSNITDAVHTLVRAAKVERRK